MVVVVVVVDVALHLLEFIAKNLRREKKEIEKFFYCTFDLWFCILSIFKFLIGFFLIRVFEIFPLFLEDLFLKTTAAIN